MPATRSPWLPVRRQATAPGRSPRLSSDAEGIRIHVGFQEQERFARAASWTRAATDRRPGLFVSMTAAGSSHRTTPVFLADGAAVGGGCLVLRAARGQASRPRAAASTRGKQLRARCGAGPRRETAVVSSPFRGSRSCARMSPVSNFSATRWMVTPVSASPARMAAVMGEGPRYRGSRDGWTLMPPSGKRARKDLPEDLPVRGHDKEVRRQGAHLLQEWRRPASPAAGRAGPSSAAASLTGERARLAAPAGRLVRAGEHANDLVRMGRRSRDGTASDGVPAKRMRIRLLLLPRTRREVAVFFSGRSGPGTRCR